MSGIALDRQIRPIYDAIDSGANKSAVASCNKFLKKYPQNDLVKALKALALVRMQKVEEPMAICDEVLASKPNHDGTLNAMMLTLRQLGRHNDTVMMFEDALKRQPQNEELALQTFFSYVRTGNWKAGQLLSTKMNKQFAHSDHYQYWFTMCAVLQANDQSTPTNMREVLYKLAHRVISSSWKPHEGSSERLYLYLTVLRELRLHDEAITLLRSEQGQVLCAKSLVCDEMRREIFKSAGLVNDEGIVAQDRILKKGDRNWLEFISIVDAGCPSSESRPTDGLTITSVEKAREFLVLIAEKDGKKDRSAVLAQLELEKRARAHDLSNDPNRLLGLLRYYLETFGDKAVCYEDLLPYIELSGKELAQWTKYLHEQSHSLVTASELQRSINVHKLVRYNLLPSEVTPEAELARALNLVEQYLSALSLGSSLAKTELQPADDLIILASQTLVNAYCIARNDYFLHIAISVLEYGLLKSGQSYKIRLLLVRIYRLLSAPQLALEHYRQLGVKQVQNDTMSHYVLSRASMFSLASTGDLTYVSECLEASQVYMSNSQETTDFIVRAFTGERYSQIVDFIAFEDRLDNSLARDLVKIEHVRMRVTHEPIIPDLIDMEAIELKFIFERAHHDNRDLNVIPSYQPRSSPSFYTQTTLFEKDPGLGWLNTFLKIYIRALKLASDVDTNVEEKLLIGDRPKPSVNEDSDLPLLERLTVRKREDLNELTEDELSFFYFSADLCDWLAPYHDFSRPPPSVVLAEADKQSQLRAKGINPSVFDNGGSNGVTKRNEEPPPVQEAPSSLIGFFDKMQVRFRGLLSSNGRPHDLLHVATLSQEALIILAIVTLRFKNPSLVKVNKFSSLVQSLKGIRVRALDVITEMSVDLVKLGDAQTTPENRQVFVKDCEVIGSFAQISQDHMLEVAKKTSEARKKLLVGIGKGMKRLCQAHTL